MAQLFDGDGTRATNGPAVTRPPLHALLRSLAHRVAEHVEIGISGPAGEAYRAQPAATRHELVVTWVETLASALEREDPREALERAEVYGQAHGLAGSSVELTLGGFLALERAMDDALADADPEPASHDIQRIQVAASRVSARAGTAWAREAGRRRRAGSPPGHESHPPSRPLPVDTAALTPAALAAIERRIDAEMRLVRGRADLRGLRRRVEFLCAALGCGGRPSSLVTALATAIAECAWREDQPAEDVLLEVLAFRRAVEHVLPREVDFGPDDRTALAEALDAIVYATATGLADRDGVRTWTGPRGRGPSPVGTDPAGPPPAVSAALARPGYRRTSAVGRPRTVPAPARRDVAVGDAVA